MLFQFSVRYRPQYQVKMHACGIRYFAWDFETTLDKSFHFVIKVFFSPNTPCFKCNYGIVQKSKADCLLCNIGNEQRTITIRYYMFLLKAIRKHYRPLARHWSCLAMTKTRPDHFSNTKMSGRTLLYNTVITWRYDGNSMVPKEDVFYSPVLLPWRYHPCFLVVYNLNGRCWQLQAWRSDLSPQHISSGPPSDFGKYEHTQQSAKHLLNNTKNLKTFSVPVKKHSWERTFRPAV